MKVGLSQILYTWSCHLLLAFFFITSNTKSNMHTTSHFLSPRQIEAAPPAWLNGGPRKQRGGPVRDPEG